MKRETKWPAAVLILAGVAALAAGPGVAAQAAASAAPASKPEAVAAVSPAPKAGPQAGKGVSQPTTKPSSEPSAMPAAAPSMPLGVSASAAAPSSHRVVSGDTLWDLAQKYYQDPYAWPQIASANKGVVKNPDLIFPGQKIVIPGLAASAPASASAPKPAPAAARVPAPEPMPAPQAPAAPAPPEPEAQASAAPSAPSSDWNAIKGPIKAMPPSMVSQYPSVKRLEEPSGWTADGKVIGSQNGNALSVAGDSVRARLKPGYSADAGAVFSDYRRDALREGDTDPDAVYLVRVARLVVLKPLGKSLYLMRVEHEGGPVEAGDLLKEGAGGS